MILIVENQKSASAHSMQDVISHSIHFGSVQPNAQNQHSTYGVSIIETIRTQILQPGNNEESQLHTNEPGFMVQNGNIGASSGSGKEAVSVH